MRRGRAGRRLLKDAGICDGDLDSWTGESDRFPDTFSWYGQQDVVGGREEGVRVREMTRVAPRYGLSTGHPMYKVERRGGQVSLPVNLSVSPGDIK